MCSKNVHSKIVTLFFSSEMFQRTVELASLQWPKMHKQNKINILWLESYLFSTNFSEIFQCTVDHVSAFDKANGRPFVAVSLLHCTALAKKVAAAAVLCGAAMRRRQHFRMTPF